MGQCEKTHSITMSALQMVLSDGFLPNSPGPATSDQTNRSIEMNRRKKGPPGHAIGSSGSYSEDLHWTRDHRADFRGPVLFTNPQERPPPVVPNPYRAESARW